MAGLTNLVETLSDTVIEDRPELEALLQNIRELTDMLAQHDDLLRSILQLMAGLTNLVETLSDTVIEDRPELEALLQNIRELTDMLAQHDDLLRSILQSGPVALRGIANATGNGNAASRWFSARSASTVKSTST
ncbi:mammalian cell entry protein, partial [Mycolicibacterium sphagni]|nr:mammalian cell entry protein [Mycolicibacterium sphagni]